MAKRFLAAALGVPAVLALCWWGPQPFSIGVAALAVVAALELICAFRASGVRPGLVFAALGLIGPALPLIYPEGLSAAGAMPLTSVAMVAITALICGMIMEVARASAQPAAHVATQSGAGLFCGVYVALFGSISSLRLADGIQMNAAITSPGSGFWLVILVLCCVWSTDTGAYMVGSRIGRTRLAPTLSPRKTVEGAVAGFTAGILVGAILGHFMLGRSLLGWMIGACAGTAGQLGDLFASAVKRELGIKDFGSLIPGHGGVMDRCDSLLFVAPLVWVLVRMFG
ncbi:MAG: phosphatidate cytidylyltransferase [Chthonomonadales bacterium]|nr:phosphatidate cytidylyltransferase [Chthonomonadales bacterium]